MDRQRRFPFYQLVDGIKRSPFLIPDIARKALKYIPRDGDIVLVTYPKCGTHWTMHIMQLILHRGRGALSYPDLARRTPILENQGLELLEDEPSPRIIGTHFQLLRDNYPQAKYVYVARNPWDACVSLFYYVRDLPKFHFEDGVFEDFLEAFMAGDLGYGDYFDHVLHGYARKDDPNVFFCTYEELKADAPGMILKLAYFLGEEYGKTLEGNEEMFQEVLKRSSFEFMSSFLEPGAETFSAVAENSPTAWNQCSKIGLDNNEENGFRLFRKGKVNDWKTLFTPEQVKRMQAWIDKRTEGTNLMNLWSMK